MKEVVPGIAMTAVEVKDTRRVIPYLGERLQAVRAPCYEVVAHSALLAKRSFERGTNNAKTLGGELLIRLSGNLQIREAIKKVGLSRGVNYLVLFGTLEELEEIIRNLDLEEVPMEHCNNETAKKHFEISALVEAL
jgi:KEOPS complex subunit Cgi121